MSTSHEVTGARPERAYLLPPPRVLQHGELPPIIEPALRGVPPFEGPAPDHFEPFVSEELESALSPEPLDRIREVVLGDEAVKQHLADVRFEWIGVSALDQKDGEGALLAVLYSYAANRAIEVRLNRDGEQIEEVSSHAYQPPPTTEEIHRAVDLARSHPRLAKEVDELEGTAILVSPSDPASASFNHRRFDVRFGCASERLPQFMAMVDLSREAVVSVGSCTGRELAPREEGMLS